MCAIGIQADMLLWNATLNVMMEAWVLKRNGHERRRIWDPHQSAIIKQCTTRRIMNAGCALEFLHVSDPWLCILFRGLGSTPQLCDLALSNGVAF
jgi:hypothetical protein